jgi:hypothetical protein
MASDETFESFETFETDASAPLTTMREAPLARAQKKAEMLGSEQLLVMLLDPDVDLAEVSRLIAMEMMGLVHRLRNPELVDPLDRSVNLSTREVTDLIKSYREIQRTLNDGEAAKRKDALNLEGAKFGYALKEIVGYFKAALKDAGASEAMQKQVLFQFGDHFKNNIESLKKGLTQI